MSIKFATHSYLESKLDKTFLPKVLIDIILEYTKSSIKIEFSEGGIKYINESEFSDIDTDELKVINIYGVLVLTDPVSKFSDSEIETITGNVVLIGDTIDMFFYAKNFNGDISGWDTSQVKNMSSMFYGVISFNSDLSMWDTSKVTDMSLMFYEATSFNSDISGWDTSKVTDMYKMFVDAENFNSDISGWDTSKVTDMYLIFRGATKFNSDISGWDTSQVENSNCMC